MVAATIHSIHRPLRGGKERPRVHNLEHLHRGRGYRHTDRDPDMEYVCDLISKSELGIGDIIERVLDASNNSVSISYTTINNWLSGKTRRPQNFTLYWVSYALGYERKWRKLK